MRKPCNIEYLKNKKWGSLVVLYEYEPQIVVYGGYTRKIKRFLCLCDCGNRKIIRGYSITSGDTKSCGCRVGKNLKTHGLYKKTCYRTWKAMRERCDNKNNVSHERYGGRGIKVCKRWENFENFYKDMGDKPKGATLERINNNKDYKPSNCRWASYSEQANNRSNNTVIKIDGVDYSLSQASNKFKISYNIIRKRNQKHRKETGENLKCTIKELRNG